MQKYLMIEKENFNSDRDAKIIVVVKEKSGEWINQSYFDSL